MPEEKFTALVRFESASREEYDHFLVRSQEIGGMIIFSEAVVEEAPGQYEVDRTSFDEIAKERGVIPSWRTRYWNSLISIHSNELFSGTKRSLRPKIEAVDLRLVRSRLRTTEEGERLIPHGIGAVIWNIVADITNERISDDSTLEPLLHWEDNIHPYLERRDHRAVDELAGRYAALASLKT